MTGRPRKPIPGHGGCWGGFNQHIGSCLKKPRKNCLTCWHHRDQESAAQRLKKRLDKEEQILEMCMKTSCKATE